MERLSSKYMTIDNENGIKDVFIIFGILSLTFVFVRSATKRALVDTGEHLSPKKIPESIAPPENIGFTPIAFESVIHMMPMVAALPKEVPVKKEISEFIRKTAAKNHPGLIKGSV